MRFQEWDASLPAAEILVEGELSPFEHEALCLLELPPSTNGGPRYESHSLSTISKASSPQKVFPTPAHGRPHLSLTRFAAVFQKAYRASKFEEGAERIFLAN